MKTILLLTLLAQDAGVDQAKVDAAIKKGADWLKLVQPFVKPWKDELTKRDMRADELLLWTLVHAGVPETDETFRALLKNILESPLQRTYNVSLQALILEEIDRVKYQWRIAQCAQFLADNQCPNGEWGYGETTAMPAELETPSKTDVATGMRGKEKPKPVRQVAIKKRQPGPSEGDSSNAQYAALGIRACAQAGIVFEPQLLKRAAGFWEQTQKDDGGWCYGPREGDHPRHASYGSMTAGGVGSLSIYACLLGEKWVGDRRIERGVKWLADHFSIEKMPGRCEHGEKLAAVFLHYYLYALERACALYGTEKLGGHAWYAEGATYLLAQQAKDGSWGDLKTGTAAIDTCFAILFLRRATRPLEPVPTVDKKR